MSSVEFKKTLCRPVEFKGQESPLEKPQKEGGDTSCLWNSLSFFFPHRNLSGVRSGMAREIAQ